MSRIPSAEKIVQEDIARVLADLSGEIGRLDGKTLLITGPEGLLASYLVETVAAANDQGLFRHAAKVIGLARTAVTPDSRLGHLLGRPDMEFFAHDVRTPWPIPGKVDLIVHAAGRSAPATFQADPLGTIDVNVNGLRWLLEYARTDPVESLLFMSSGEIYGDPPPDRIPTTETFTGNVSTLSPRACYTEAKRLGETLCAVYFSKFSVPAKIARPFIVYGPGLEISDRRVMTDFIRSGIEGKPIKMLTAGKDTRSYCYISDATVAFWRLLFSDLNADPVNIASDLEEVSIRELAELVHELCGIADPVEVPATGNEDISFLKAAPSRVRPDITKIRERFGFEPRVNLKEGLRRTIDWNLARLGKPPLHG